MLELFNIIQYCIYINILKPEVSERTEMNSYLFGGRKSCLIFMRMSKTDGGCDAAAAGCRIGRTLMVIFELPHMFLATDTGMSVGTIVLSTNKFTTQ